ncbi:MAG: lysophospholipase [Alphaproteobacteria bacterium]|nr:MAG: lysophospholipase [Alphaproteobacteria bacterium]
MVLAPAAEAAKKKAEAPKTDLLKGERWVTVWTASVQGPYPVGNPSAQPVLSFAFPAPESGARDQTFRLILQPEIWGSKARLRFSNVFGTRPVSFDGIYVGLQQASATLFPNSNRQVMFGGRPNITIPPGESVWSDLVTLGFTGDQKTLTGRKLAVSFHLAGESGPMTWHAKALQTSYVSPPGSGSQGAAEDERPFPYTTASWFFLDAVDMMAPADTRVIVCFGDSITDGTASTMNGDDRWPNVLSRRLRAAGHRAVVLNAGIGGNQVAGPSDYSPQKPYAGGPSAGARVERDVLSLSGVNAVIWLEGINDFSKNGNASGETVQTRMKEIASRMRARQPGLKVFGATVVTALGSTSAAHGFPEQDEKRQALNQFIRTSGVFDGVVDFDSATIDPGTGGLKPEFVPESTTGGPGDKLHPNRAGYLAMGSAVDLDMVMGKSKDLRPSAQKK